MKAIGFSIDRHPAGLHLRQHGLELVGSVNPYKRVAHEKFDLSARWRRLCCRK
jgi:hypothetical protein